MDKQIAMPVGIIVQKRRIAHPWQEWAWEPAGVLPGAAADVRWKLLREEPDLVQYHAATMTLELHRAETEAYVANLETGMPAVYVGLRPGDEDAGENEVEPSFVTVSPYLAQDRLDSAEEIIERVAMPDVILEWVEIFIAAHHEDETFVKRRRDRIDLDRVDDGRGDPRVHGRADVFRAPTARTRH